MEEMNKNIAENMSKIKHKIVVMSGKGGVGKSTIATNIAFGLALEGKTVGILDGDLHGPNIPLMVGAEGKKLTSVNTPFEVHSNIKVVSLSFFMNKSSDPIVWRGPKKIGAIKQLLGEVKWGELDYLVVDLPPGTGDEPLTIAQDLGAIDGCVIVTTPQDVALLDSRKSVTFANLVNMPIMGIVENMSGFVCPHCGERIDIFKQGGGEKAAKEMRVPFLGKIPMTPDIVEAGDEGRPYIYYNNNGIAVEAMRNLVEQIISSAEGDEDKVEKSIFKIAFPTNDKQSVESHFGHCKQFAIFHIADKKIKETNYVDAPPHQPGLLPKFLGGHEIDTIITGGMGQRAIDLFKEQGIEVILGAKGAIESNLNEYLEGDLYSTGSACSHDHDNHTCSH